MSNSDKKNLYLIYEDQELISIVFEELKFNIGKEETIIEFFNRAKDRIEEKKGLNFREYFEIDRKDNLDNIVKLHFPIEKNIEETTNHILETSETKINSVKLHKETINKCIDDIFTGKQISVQHSDYTVGENLFATQDVGKKRNNQEDSILIMEHSKNKDFKLLAVADGMGGEDAGELVSRHIVAKLTEWFENIDPRAYTNMNYVEQSLNQMLPNILNDLNNVPKQAGATLSCAIVGQDQTLITNIGDSRVYTMKDNNLTQQTEDDSYVQMLYNNGEIPNKELMKFHKKNNAITQSISKINDPIPNYKIIENSSYDKIIAVSDGITDCLSQEELRTLMSISRKNYVAKNIVEGALNSNSTLERTLNNLPSNERQKVISIINKKGLYNNVVNGGKDNTSVAAFIKK